MSTYIPEEHCDEWTPPGRETPEDWLVVAADGSAALAPAEVNAETAARPLADGEIVEFVTFTDYGEQTLTLRDDFTFAGDPVMPAGATYCCADGDADTLASSLDELAQDFKYADAAPGEISVQFYTYSDSVALRFDLATRTFSAPGALQ